MVVRVSLGRTWQNFGHFVSWMVSNRAVKTKPKCVRLSVLQKWRDSQLGYKTIGTYGYGWC